MDNPVDPSRAVDTDEHTDAPVQQVPAEQVIAARKRSMWNDPVVRVMGLAIVGLVILFLAGIVSALYFGLLNNPAPRTFSEREVMAWQSAVSSEDADIEQWQSYIVALIDDGQYTRAQQYIDQVASIEEFDQVKGANMLYSQAMLKSATGDRLGAIDMYDEAMVTMDEAFETELERGGDQNWANSFGRHTNYYLGAMQRSALLREEGRLDEAIEMLDIYLDKHRTHAGVIVDRGDIKAENGDLAGAEADYREALKFMPEDPGVLEALEMIGVDE